MNTELKVAIVHDWIYGGGAELVVEQLHILFPEAPIYTSFVTPEWQQRLDNKVVTGYLQKWPFSKLHRFLPVLRQYWFSSLDLSEYDLVISSSGNGEAKFVRVNKPAVHICYCHTPTHFYWRKYNSYLAHPGFKPAWLARFGLKTLVKPLRRRDYAAARKIDYFVANSTHIQSDIQHYYGKESAVIHPPVHVENFPVRKNPIPESAEPHFITWGRIVRDKRFDIAIEACNKLRLPLTVIGKGPHLNELKKIAGPTITFTGYASHEELVELAQKATAFIFPSEEDFGIAPVEALALGLPVIAYKSGGALDYISEPKTGTFFSEQTPESLAKVLKSFNPGRFKSGELRKTAEEFSAATFRTRFITYVNNVLKEHRESKK